MMRSRLALIAVAIVGAVSPGPGASAERSLVVTLSADRMVPGDRVTATVRDTSAAAGAGRPVVWTSSSPRVAVVSHDGSVRALGYGETTIAARVGGRVGRATLRVVGGLFEPEGMTTITDRTFGLPVEDWDPVERDRATNMRFVAEPGAPRSPGGVLLLRYPTGFVGGSSPGIGQKPFKAAGYTTLYSSFWVRFSSDWQGHRTSGNKIFYWWIAGGAHVYVLAEGAGDRPLTAAMHIQGVPDARHRLRPNLVPDARFVRGQWHHVEVLLRPNAVGRADGVVAWWLDGVAVGEFRDLAILRDTVTDRTWDQIQLAPVWGGGGDTVRVEQTLALDHVYVSGSR